MQEILKNNGMGILEKPIQILGDLLAAVAGRAIELNDPQLNALMVRLALYEQADPYSKDYDPALVKSVLEQANAKER